jgi:hypothetical protein
VSGAAEPWVQHFTVTFGDDELRACHSLLARRYTRRDDALTYWGLLYVTILAIGLATFGAFELGLIETTALKPVLLTAYASSFAGAMSYWYAVHRHNRAFYRNYARARRTWHYCFDDSGISYKNDAWQVHLLWRGVDSVEDLGWGVMLHTGEQVVLVPVRAFSDTTTRTTFVAASAARIEAAREVPKN